MILLLVLVSTVAKTFASNQQSPSILIPHTDRRTTDIHSKPQPPTVPTFGEHQLFGSAVKKHANGDLKGAIAGYLAAIKVQDKDPAVHWYLGTAYRALGEEAKAKREFFKERVMKLVLNKPVQNYYPGGYKKYSGNDADFSPTGDFGSSRMKFVPNEGLIKIRI
ncbi:MAG: tetratricopeptide repeat protein [Candidatus Obscuribacterales bacterium]